MSELKDRPETLERARYRCKACGSEFSDDTEEASLPSSARVAAYEHLINEHMERLVDVYEVSYRLIGSRAHLGGYDLSDRWDESSFERLHPLT